MKLSNLVSIAFVIGAIVLAYQGKEGWGWCIFGAIVCHSS